MGRAWHSSLGLSSRAGRGAWPGRAAPPETVARDCPGIQQPHSCSLPRRPHIHPVWFLEGSLPDSTVLLGLVIPFISENKTFVFLDLESNRQALKKTLRVYGSMIKAVLLSRFPHWPLCSAFFHDELLPLPATVPPSTGHFPPPHCKSDLPVPLAGICVLRLSKIPSEPHCHF